MMHRIRGAICFCVYYSGLLALCLHTIQVFRRRHTAAILMYHRVVSTDSEPFFDKGPCIHRPLKHFKSEMAFLSKWFQVVGMDEIVASMAAPDAFREPTVVVTFDDGYLDNYEYVLPVLKRQAIPATIYLTTAVIGTKELLWPDQVEHILLRTDRTSFRFEMLFDDAQIDLATHDARRRANSMICKALKLVGDSQRHRLINELGQCLDVGSGEGGASLRRMLNWDEVRDMSRNGISFGAHTVSHPILSKISTQSAVSEIQDSRAAIEAHVGAPVNHFAIPNGSANDFTEALKTYCVDSGLTSIVTTEHGTVSCRSDPMFLRRVSPRGPIWNFACELSKLFLFPSRYPSEGGNYLREEDESRSAHT